jgi:glycosyltransferase involved in cell wall biosynthesis
LSEVGDIDEMVEKGLYILSDEKRHKDFKANAKQVALKFDVDKVVLQYEAVYESAFSNMLT